MIRSGRIEWKILIFLLYANAGYVYAQELWSDVKLKKSSVYVGEPVEVAISVYTSTWFTRGIDLGNIKVNGAFSVYFRPVSKSFKINGQTYAGVELIYHVFPYSDKDLVFPSLSISVETPPKGGYKGVRRTIASAEKQIRVKPFPAGFDEDEWLVTTSVSISDRFKGNLKDVKVGDVLVRQITRVAQGTVSELIPPIQWDSIQNVSLYGTRSIVSNNKTKISISATRTETMRFLFEKEGEITIPEMVFSWYDPIRKKLFKRTLKEIKVEVQPNPDLGVLTTVRDSLLRFQEGTMQESDEEKPLLILGRSPGQIAILSLLGLLLLWVSWLMLSRLFRLISARREAYRNSEAYHFEHFKKAVKGRDPRAITQSLYRWLDELPLREPSMDFFASTYGSEALQDEVQLIGKQVHNHTYNLSLTICEWQKARQRFLSVNTKQPHRNLQNWINPV